MVHKLLPDKSALCPCDQFIVQKNRAAGSDEKLLFQINFLKFIEQTLENFMGYSCIYLAKSFMELVARPF